MSTIEEKLNSTGVNSGTHSLLEEMKLLKEMQDHSGKNILYFPINITSHENFSFFNLHFARF